MGVGADECADLAAECLRDARQLLCVGVGTSTPLTQDAGYRFRAGGLPAEAPPDAHVQHVTARLLSPGAVCLCFSHTGQTREPLGSINAARLAGAATIAITSFFNSPLTELVDVALVAGSRETDFRGRSHHQPHRPHRRARRPLRRRGPLQHRPRQNRPATQRRRSHRTPDLTQQARPQDG